MAEIGTDLLKAKTILEEGGLVAIPTETVYGLAANAMNTDAVLNIFEAKKRPFFDPLILHSDSIEKIKTFVEYIPLDLKLLLRTFSPGPLTVLLPKNKKISDLTTAGLPRVGVRIPAHELTLKLLSMLDFPLAAPSANPFGYVSPTTAQHVQDQLGDRIDYILDGGPCEIGVESTIVGYEKEQLTVYRKGGLEIETIQEMISDVYVRDFSDSNPAAPGMLKSHYSPKKQILEWKDELHEYPLNKTGILAYCEIKPTIPKENQFLLSQKKDLKEAARNLFKGLRFLDNLAIDTIYVEMVPEQGLGVAINDRLKRALAKN